MACSVGVLNLIACTFGGMPMCHGAGGLAAQYRFGARHGASMVFLGSVKVILALALGGALMHLLEVKPSCVAYQYIFPCSSHICWSLLARVAGVP